MRRLIQSIAEASAIAAALVLAACPVAAFAQAEESADGALAEALPHPELPRRKVRTIITLNSGFTFTSGDYGRPVSTDVYFAPLSLRLQHGPWRARVSTSFIAIDGPASIIDGDAGSAELPAGAPHYAMSTRSSLGDVSLQLGYRLRLDRHTALTGDARIKFPTASERERLTTGTTDVTLRAQLSERIGAVTLRAGGRRRLAGGDGRVTVRDTWGANAGASVDLGDGVSVGADYDWIESAFGNAPNSTANGWVSVPLSRRLRITGYGGTGFSSNSPDLQVGTAITLRID